MRSLSLALLLFSSGCCWGSITMPDKMVLGDDTSADDSDWRPKAEAPRVVERPLARGENVGWELDVYELP